MSSFVVTKKNFDLNSSNGTSFLVSRQSRELKTLPYDAEVEYLESTGTQWIDTGIQCDAICGFSITCEAIVATFDESYPVIAGAQFSDWRNWLAIYEGNGNVDVGDVSMIIGREVNQKITAFLNYMGDKKITVESPPPYTARAYFPAETPANICIFAAGTEVGAMSLSKSRVYSMAVSSGQNIVRVFVPVRFTNNQGQIEGAMYDKVSGQLFTNQGSGSFTIGDDLPKAGLMTPLKRTFDMPLTYILNPTNGQALSSFQSTFPSGKYDALTAEPVWTGHRFVGWFPANKTPSQATPSTAGIMTSESSTSCEVLTAFAHWQLPIQIQFDATTNGGQMPSGWSAPYYYIGQQLQALPTPTHSTMNFGGWFTAATGGTKVTAETIATASMNNITLYAQYVSTTYELPNLGDDWELNTNLNPDPALYDGCYQSFSNVGVNDSDAILMIHTIGYSTFKFYLRSYAESTYDYCYCECSTGSVVSEQEKSADELYYEQKKAEYESQGYYVECYNDYDNWYSWNVYDQDWNQIDSGSFESSGDPSSTRGKQNSDTSINGYQLVTYQFNDPTENYIYVHYIKDSSAADGDDRGYVLIPYDQN